MRIVRYQTLDKNAGVKINLHGVVVNNFRKGVGVLNFTEVEASPNELTSKVKANDGSS